MQVPEYVYGNIAPTFSAFDDKGAFDADGQRNLMDFMESRGGISSYFVRSGMGQIYTYDETDFKALADCACSHMEGRKPVLIGANGVWDRNYDKRPDAKVYMEECIRFAQYARDAGASGVVYTMPEALVPADGESPADLVKRYFTTLCAGVDLPVFMYQPPGTLKEYMLTRELIAELADIDNLVGAKASYADGEYVFNLIRAVKNKDFKYIIGAETIWALGLYAGSQAVIGQGSTLNPQVISKVQECFEAGDREGTLAAQDAVNELVYACSNPQDFYKKWAIEQGFPLGLYHRSMHSNPYATDPTPLDDAAFQHAKNKINEVEARLGITR